MRRALVLVALSLLVSLPARAQTQAPQPDIGQWQGSRALSDIVTQTGFGVRAMDTPGHQKTVALIEQTLRDLGLTVSEQRFDSSNPTHHLTNIVARLYPDAPHRVILGTHYDSISRAFHDKVHPEAPMPGANNSASGVALLLETARALHAQKTAPGIGVDFVFFDGEEGSQSMGDSDPNFQPVGSPYFADHLADFYPAAKPDQAVIFDMVCWREEKLQPESASLHFAPQQIAKFWNIGRTFAPAYFSMTPSQGEIFDDQAALDLAHVPSFLVIGFDYEPWYNTVNDTPDKCSEAALNGVGRTLLRYLYMP